MDAKGALRNDPGLRRRLHGNRRMPIVHIQGRRARARTDRAPALIQRLLNYYKILIKLVFDTNGQKLRNSTESQQPWHRTG